MSKRKSLNGIIESITTDIRKKTKAALEYAGEKISGDFNRMAYLALDSYYGEYTKPPRVYNRTNILKNDSFYSVNERTGFKVNAGIIFDEERMNHEKLGYKAKRDSNGNIIRGADGKAIIEDYITEYQILSNFMHGIHGWEGLHDGVDQKIVMDKYYQDYHNSNTAYNYFKEYMDR
jgi:hypothetical protein